MTQSMSSSDTTELSAAVTTALALICNQLIETGALNRAKIEADLVSEVDRLRSQSPSVLKEMILSGLAFALRAPLVQDGSVPEGRTGPDRNEKSESFFDPEIPINVLGQDD